MNNEIFYLSLNEQKKIKFRIINYLKSDSYYRKSIVCLFAIYYGAAEIYELDENLETRNISFIYDNFKSKVACYGKRNDSLMINPYFNFEEKIFGLEDLK